MSRKFRKKVFRVINGAHYADSRLGGQHAFAEVTASGTGAVTASGTGAVGAWSGQGRGSARLVRVLGRLFLLFTVVSAVELWLLITVGGLLGPLPTLATIVATGMLGATLARREGSRVLEAWKQTSITGQAPKDGITASALVLVGGVLLVTPGVLTDLVGLALLLPGIRRPVAKRLQAALQKRFSLQAMGPGAFAGMARGAAGDFIDVDARDPEASEPNGADPAPARALRDQSGSTP